MKFFLRTILLTWWFVPIIILAAPIVYLLSPFTLKELVKEIGYIVNGVIYGKLGV